MRDPKDEKIRGKDFAEFVAKNKKFLSFLDSIRYNTKLLADGKGSAYHQSMNLLIYLKYNGLYRDENRPSILAINLCIYLLEKNHGVNLGVDSWPTDLRNLYERCAEEVYVDFAEV